MGGGHLAYLASPYDSSPPFLAMVKINPLPYLPCEFEERMQHSRVAMGFIQVMFGSYPGSGYVLACQLNPFS